MTKAFIAPDAANLAAFGALPQDAPIHMINFLRFHERAQYPAGHEHADKGWSGERAYEEYGRAIMGPFGRAGARIVWRGAFGATTIGPADETWDDMLIVQYPSAKAFFEMISGPEYQEGAVNRTAALADSRLYRTAPTTPLV